MANLNDIEDFVSPLINQQFPNVYRDDADLMVLFVKAYYEHLEETNRSLNISRDLLQQTDVDQSVDDFLDHFKKTYLYSIPDETTVDPAFLIKHILDLYRSKGSKRALELFFKLVYNRNVDLYIPNEHIVRASDATYVIPRFVECFIPDEDILKTFFGTVTGETSGATAYVTSIMGTSVAGTLLSVLFLESLEGEFIADELLINQDATNKVRLNGSLSDISIENGGNNYSVGDLITVKSAANTSTMGKIKVLEVVDGTGVPDFKLQEGGAGYSTNTAISNVVVSETILEVNAIANTAVAPAFSNSGFVKDFTTYYDINTRPANTFELFETLTTPRVVLGLEDNDAFFEAANSSSYVEGIAANGDVIANGHVGSVTDTRSEEFKVLLDGTDADGTDAGSVLLLDGTDGLGTDASNNVVYEITTFGKGSMVVFETSGSFSSDVEVIRFAGNTIANTLLVDVANGYATGEFVGKRGNTIGITNVSVADNSSAAWPSDSQAFITGSTSNTGANIIGNRSGNNTVITIKTVTNARTVNVFTDFINANNSGNIPFANLRIDGAGSNVDNVATFNILLDGTNSSQTNMGSKLILDGTDSSSTDAGNNVVADDHPPYGFSKSSSANFLDTIDKALTSQSELLGEVLELNITNTGNNYTSDPIVLTQNRFIDNYLALDISLNYVNKAGPPFEAGDILITTKTKDLKTFTFNTAVSNTFTVGEGVVQVVNSTVNTFGTVRESNTTSLKLGDLKTVTRGEAVFVTGSSVNLIGNTITGLVNSKTVDPVENIILNQTDSSGSDAGSSLLLDGTNSSSLNAGNNITTETATVRTTANTTENNDATAKVLTINNTSQSLTARRITPDYKFEVGEIVKNGDSSKAAEITRLGEGVNTYNRFIKTGVNANTFANVKSGTGIISKVGVVESGLRFKEGEKIDFTVLKWRGPEDQLISGNAVVNGTGIGEGYWKDNTGSLNEDYFIHDNDFYQTFSYQVLSEFELNKYEKALKDVIHTTGYKLFGRVVVDSFNNTEISIANSSVTQA